MDIKLVYKIMQAEWVRINDVKIGTTVKITRLYKTDEMGCDADGIGDSNHWIGKEFTVNRIQDNHIVAGCYHPFFVFEVVRQPEPEKMLMVRGKEYSESTIANALQEYAK